MKRIILLVFLCSLGANAQDKKHNKRFEKIKAHKTSYITEKLSLTSAEAEKFWPIYNSYEENVQKLREKERTEVFGKLKENGVDALSDAEANTLLATHFDIKSQMLEKEKSLMRSLKGVISPQKIIKLEKAEQDFKKKLLRRYGGRDRGPENDENRKRGPRGRK